MSKMRMFMSNTNPPTLIDYLYQNHEFDSMKDVRRLIVKGKVFINGFISKDPEALVGKNDVVELVINASFTEELTLPETTIKKLPKSKIPFENEHIAIVEKTVKDTMDLNIEGNLGQRLAITLKANKEDTSHLAHLYKLDDVTKGLVLYAKTNQAFEYLNDCINNKLMECTYLVVSIPAPFLADKKHMELTPPLFRDQNNRYKKSKKQSIEDERLVVDYLGGINIKGEKYPILKVKTKLPRRANIRFLLAYYGMTIINDKKLANHRVSDDLLLFNYKIELPKKAEDILGLNIFSADKKAIMNRLRKVLEKTLKKGYA